MHRNRESNPPDDRIDDTTMATKKPTIIPLNLLDTLFPTSIKVGSHEVEIRSFKETAGHDDSMPYQAKIHVDGKECAVVYNDGWGGESNIQGTKTEAYKVLNELEQHIHSHKEEFFMGEYEGHKLYHSNLASICDTLAMNCGYRKDALKYENKRMVLFNSNTQSISTVSFKGMGRQTISDLMSTSHQFRTLWYDTVEKYKAKGYTILNDNFAERKAV